MSLKTKYPLLLLINSLLFLLVPLADIFAESEAKTVPRSAHLLSKYLQFESVTGNEKPAGEFFVSLCREKGLHTRIFSDDQDNYNFACSLYPLEDQKQNIILLNHIDVVPGGDADHWRFPAFSGTIYNDTIWGRGAIDMKGMGIMQLMATAEFIELAGEKDLPFNVTVLGVSGEENLSSVGAVLVTEKYLEELNPLVVLGEGGSGIRGILKKNPDQLVFAVSVADKKSLWIDLTFHYSSLGHGSVPPENYANKIMIKSLHKLLNKKERLHFSETTRGTFRKLGELEGGLRGFLLKNAGFFKPLIARSLRKEPLILASLTNTLAITGIDNPEGTTNQIPQEVNVALDCRLLPETETDAYILSLKKRLSLENAELAIRQKSPRSMPSETGIYYRSIEQALLKVYPGSAVMPILFIATTDNNYFRRKGIPVYGITPYWLSEELQESIHNVNERIAINDLQKGIEVYIEFINTLISQPTPR